MSTIRFRQERRAPMFAAQALASGDLLPIFPTED